jgi:hypothetical protein
MEWKALHAYRRARQRGRKNDLAFAYGIFTTSDRLQGAHMAAAYRELVRSLSPLTETIQTMGVAAERAMALITRSRAQAK